MPRRDNSKGFMPAAYEPADVRAMQALAAGEANDHQQKQALKWIIEKACETYGFAFKADDRNTNLALGRQFAGQQIVKLLHLNASKLTSNKEPTEQG